MYRFRLFLALMGGGTALLLPFSDAFGRDDGDLGNGWLYTAGKWTIASGAAVGTPGLGSTLLINGNMETGDPPSNWSVLVEETLDGVADERTGGAGVQSLSLIGSSGGVNQQVTNALNIWLHLNGWARKVTVTASLRLMTSAYGTIRNSVVNNTTSWSKRYVSGRATTTNCRIALINGFGAGGEARFDDIFAGVITLADMFSVRNFGVSDIDISVDLTILDGNPCGIVICLDSISTPANFIYAIHDGINISLAKNVAGTYTVLISPTAASYAAGRTMRVKKVGQIVQLYYNGVQIDVDKTVSDVGIISNTLHGKMTTMSGNSFDNFSAANP